MKNGRAKDHEETELTEDIRRLNMTISNEKYEETSYFTVKIHKTHSSNAFFPSIFFFLRLLRVQKQMDSSTGAGWVPIFKFHFRFFFLKC